MYLTKLILDAETVYKEKVHDDYAIHKLVYSLFDYNQKEQNPRILYVRHENAGGCLELLILSKILPENTKSFAMSTIVINDHFFDNGKFHFETVLNPVKKDPATGKRIALTGELPLLRWFVNHAGQWGFQVDEETLEHFVRNSQSFEKNGATYRFNKVLFRGTLTVTDKERFRKSFENGLGHGKAFGFGLLLLQPAK